MVQLINNDNITDLYSAFALGPNSEATEALDATQED